MASNNDLITHDAKSLAVPEAVIEELTFLYHPKHGAELFKPSEAEKLSEYGWVDTPAGFKCPPYEKKQSFKTVYARKHNKSWKLDTYRGISEPKKLGKKKGGK